MNQSQKRYFTLLQMLENMQAAITAMQADIKEIGETSAQTCEIALVLNARLLFAGQALLGKQIRGFKNEAQEKFNFGQKFPE